VYSAIIVIHEVERNGVAEIRKFFAESVCEPSESTHRHSHREILPLGMAGGNVIPIRLTANLMLLGGKANRR
jgi:hypothetical protein